MYKALLDGVQPVAVKVVQGMGEPRMREAFVREVSQRVRAERAVQLGWTCQSGLV